MLSYKENNIEFRIASATAISEFKAIQAHSFIQVCRKEFNFSTSAREVVLLSYDRFSHWLLKVEKAFRHEEKKAPSQGLSHMIYASFLDELAFIEEICESHINIFSTEVFEYLKVIHGYTRGLIADIFAKNLLAPSHMAFANIASSTSDYLQHLLLAMHEFNNNINKKLVPFICIGRFSTLSASPSYVSIVSRAKFFEQKLGHTAFILKNYDDQPLDDSITRVLKSEGIDVAEEEPATS